MQKLFMHFKGSPYAYKPQNAMEELKIEPLLFRVDVEWNTKGNIVSTPSLYTASDILITNREWAVHSI